jgi:glyoxylase-like metal-dependent hydrolase (beta-lactamase superfamily II)
MSSPSLEIDNLNLPENLPKIAPATVDKPPRLLREGIFAFAPNRETLGATAYFILETTGNILVDCPAWNDTNRQFLANQGGIATLVITHRGGIGEKVARFQGEFGCKIVIQEQEAYLMPEVEKIVFREELSLSEGCFLLWTAGHSPGSSCLYWQAGGGILFTGRHLLPTAIDQIQPLRVPKTFHWRRQLQSVQKLLDRFSPETLQFFCPAANTGYLRGRGMVADAYRQLQDLDRSSDSPLHRSFVL